MPPQVAEQFTTGYIVEEHIERVVIGKGCDEPRDKGVTGHITEDSALVSNMVNLLELDDLSLSQYLQGKNLLFVFIASDSRANKTDSRKCT